MYCSMGSRGNVHCGLASSDSISRKKSTMADKDNSPPHKKHRYMCKFNDNIAREYSGVSRSKKSDSLAL